MGWLADGIMRVLRERPGEVVTAREIIAAIYQGSPNGGPADAEANIRVTIHNMRKRGEIIESVSGYRVPRG